MRTASRVDPSRTDGVRVLEPGSHAELQRFAALQRELAPMFRRVFADPAAPRTVVAVPSLTLDPGELARLGGAPHYEERLLCLLMLLRLPTTHLVYVTSQPIPRQIVDYYLRYLPPTAARDAWRRLTLLSCHDGADEPLTAKLLRSPDLLDRIRDCITDPAAAHLTCFNVTALERTLAVRLGLPLYGCDPAIAHLGLKSGSRETFRRAGVLFPPGFEHLRDVDDVIAALTELRRAQPMLRRAVMKLEDGFSGEGNATFSFEGAPGGAELAAWIRAELPRRARCVAPGQTWEQYAAEFERMGGIVEAFVDGADVRSPSVQCRIDPLGDIQIISTHDQLLGGPSGQHYVGCTFPADPECSAGLHPATQRVAEVLREQGALGRFGVDFVSTHVHGEWVHHAIEINLRKGGTTHPYLMLQHLTGGEYDTGSGLYHSAAGRPCYYVASDNLCHPAYANLTADDLIGGMAERYGLEFDPHTARGVVFHMLGALQEHGKVGAVSIADTREGARALFARTVAMLDRESGRSRVAAAHAREIAMAHA